MFGNEAQGEETLSSDAPASTDPADNEDSPLERLLGVLASATKQGLAFESIIHQIAKAHDMSCSVLVQMVAEQEQLEVAQLLERIADACDITVEEVEKAIQDDP